VKKILHILGGLNRGGAETLVMNMFRNINHEKFSFDFLVPTEKKGDYYDEILSLGGSVYIIAPDFTISSVKRVIKRFFELYCFFKNNHRYEAIHIHTESVSCIVELLAAKLAGVKIRIAHSHSTNSRNRKMHRRWRFLIPLVANYRFACGEEAGKWLYGKRFGKLKNSKVIPNAIDVDKFSYNEGYRSEIRREFNIEEKTVLGNIGRIVKVKNQKLLVDIVKNMENAVAIIVGDGVLREEIQSYAEKEGVSDKVIFAGVRSDVHKFYSAFDCFVMPSFHEGFPVTLVEAQCSGVPIVVSDSIAKECDLIGIIKFISLTDTPEIWQNEILKYIKIQDKMKKQLCLEKMKETNYNIKKMIKDMEAVYGYKL